MTKQEVEQKIKEILLKHPFLKGAEIEVLFKDKKIKAKRKKNKNEYNEW